MCERLSWWCVTLLFRLGASDAHAVKGAVDENERDDEKSGGKEVRKAATGVGSEFHGELHGEEAEERGELDDRVERDGGRVLERIANGVANAGGAWDNAKKIVEVELKQKGTPLHDATVIGDTVGDPFKDTSSVALNPVIKFTTLFGLLAVELAVKLTSDTGGGLSHLLAAVFFVISFIFVYRSFYAMRIRGAQAE